MERHANGRVPELGTRARARDGERLERREFLGWTGRVVLAATGVLVIAPARRASAGDPPRCPVTLICMGPANANPCPPVGSSAPNICTGTLPNGGNRCHTVTQGSGASNACTGAGANTCQSENKCHSDGAGAGAAANTCSSVAVAHTCTQKNTCEGDGSNACTAGSFRCLGTNTCGDVVLPR